MAYKNISMPATATAELAGKLKDEYVAFFKPVFTKTQLIAEPKACYSVVINAVNKDGNKLENLLGTEHAKIEVNSIMFKLLTGKYHL